MLKTTEISKRGITEKKKTQRRQRTTTRTDGSHELVKLRGFQFHRRHRSVATEDGESSIGSRHFLFFTDGWCLFNEGINCGVFRSFCDSMLLTKYLLSIQWNSLSLSLLRLFYYRWWVLWMRLSLHKALSANARAVSSPLGTWPYGFSVHLVLRR